MQAFLDLVDEMCPGTGLGANALGGKHSPPINDGG